MKEEWPLTSKYKIFGGPLIVRGILLFSAVYVALLFWVENTDQIGVGAPILLIIDLFILSEVLKNFHVIYFCEERLEFKNSLFRTRKEYRLDEIDGFTIDIQRGKTRVYEVMILYKNRKKIGCISEFYYSNYPELRERFFTILPFLGKESTGMWSDDL